MPDLDARTTTPPQLRPEAPRSMGLRSPGRRFLTEILGVTAGATALVALATTGLPAGLTGAGGLVLAAALMTSVTACHRGEARTRGTGDPLQPFIVQNAETGEQYCQICAFSGRPTLMLVADAHDSALEPDLKRIQKLVDEHKARGLSAFLVVGAMEGTTLSSVRDAGETAAALNAMRARLGLTFPLVFLPKDMSDIDRKNYAPFDRLYAIDGARTVFLATAANRVVFAGAISGEGAEPQRRALEAALAEAL